jgi:hypothetical protein
VVPAAIATRGPASGVAPPQNPSVTAVPASPAADSNPAPRETPAVTLAAVEPTPAAEPGFKPADLSCVDQAVHQNKLSSSAPDSGVLCLERENRALYRNKVSAAYRLGLNASVRFRGSATSAPFAPGVFANGYVLPSSRQPLAPDNLTWNWGYNDSSQIVGPNAEFSSYGPTTLTSSRESNQADFLHGFEMQYNRALWVQAGHEETQIGVEFAFNFTSVDGEDSWSQNFRPVRTITPYNLGGVLPVPVPPPYAGTFDGPGSLISLTPGASWMVPGDVAALNCWRKFHTGLYGVRLGPYVEGPLCWKFRGSASTGLALLFADGQLSYRDSFSAPLPASTVFGEASKLSVLPGWYIGGRVSLDVTDSFSLFYGLQFQMASDYELQAGPNRAILDLESAIFQSFGLSLSF